MLGRRRRLSPVWAASTLAAVWLGTAAPAFAHGVSAADRTFMERGGLMAFLYLGAKHMVTGYDHILFLVGVIFFLYRIRDVVTYVSLFTLGHSLTLVGGVLADVRIDGYLVDAVIGLSVVYKGFENVGGFRTVFGVRPDPRLAVLAFGLCHGFGLATKLQDLALPERGLMANLASFNVGVEVGQVMALSAVLIGFAYWRSRPSFDRHAFAANTVLMTGGFILIGFQLAGYVVSQ
ncbi:MAG TPA: HupE/UreJ family protein [Vicinamibacterales bacterium]|nr:HupE/UreJ family protein [Vicinamibacterales bacterium]